VYAAAKAAVEQFGRTLAVELAPDGIRVNNVAPDYVPTPNMSKFAASLSAGGDEGAGMSSPEGQRVAIPMGRAGVPADISGCVVFLASALSRYVTGTTIHADGGTFASSGWFNWPGTGWANYAPTPFLSGGAPGGTAEDAPGDILDGA
jgi:NAD(P)-dependent dehydrogenase (short-subunit alcohol dehydrogenase family)